MIASHKLSDCFRELHPSLKRYTWRQENPLKQPGLISSLFQKLSWILYLNETYLQATELTTPLLNQAFSLTNLKGAEGSGD